jgi:hypothetical protein
VDDRRANPLGKVSRLIEAAFTPAGRVQRHRHSDVSRPDEVCPGRSHEL